MWSKICLFASVSPACVMMGSMAYSGIDLSAFGADALVSEPTVVACTLENGEASQCAQIVVKYKPDNLGIGPFCPATVDDAGGIWDWDGEEAGLYRLDGEFFYMLADQGYDFTDGDGHVHMIDNATVRPTVDHACIAVEASEGAEMTILLPMTPVMAENATALRTVNKVGLALDGVPIFSDAPSVAVTGHLPALDTCGGHVDPGGWYHWHATSTDIDDVYRAHGVDAHCGEVEQQASAQFGYAFDGFAMFGSQEMDGATPTGLDECDGHIGVTPNAPDGEYHYHTTLDFPNLPTCLSGVQAQNNFTTTASAGVGAAAEFRDVGPGAPDQHRGLPPGFDKAAIELGVSEDALMQAINAAGGPQLDFSKAAEMLNVSEDALRGALPPPPQR
ncbi:hypothetical protein GCM10008927_11040 [Amylibacter ulvae]|uniref:YHYH domain-containing protein n=1 Tax=Paramylibacter ulvae TaxID=1651968 RepID=A0ABQ3CY29_9RHOB|nr:YHYH protein [Amylibacter ulvae]GHA47895.1 hypothetical protein GCM10008927_11040 [Amylibacter ulvae]